MKKNILLVSHGSALGGSPISMLNIARFINKSLFNIILVFGEDGKIVETANNEGFKVYIIKKRGFLSIPTIFDFMKIIKQKNIDIVHLNTFTSYYKYPAIAAKLLNRKVTWFVRENPEEKRCVKLSKYINKYADKIVTVSYDTAEHMYYADKTKLITIHNGIDLEKYTKLDKNESFRILNLDNNFKYITTIASIEQRKGILDLLMAFNEVHRKFPSVKLLIVGKDRTTKQEYLKEIKLFIKENKLDNRVVLFGETTLIQEIMSISTIFTLCAYWEGLSRVILEAMACSKVIIASSNGGNKEQVINGLNGFTFEAGDTKKLANLFDKILSENNLANFENSSRALAEEKFDIKTTTEKIEKLYNDL